ncbi:RNase P modulator RnpM [Acetivibrio mesophilus]|uniref:YlxR family protein n=1 Tax=Acetivibrio mesophilus TaxID=2487273 RepID=A0A4Q0I667_9FIRM|nr:YlxR family protein [Acetivibrio mesophilus]ODM28025.1 nucleic acid-binding protein [Clostridium sp. Bc-iso-3]RXE59873.1 YlxR family protein [Acetivibrio mesophilus]HHV29601.1 YlxR family protein [Clostridium sp.]
MKQKKIPMRMCLGCQEMRPKKELIRVVKNKENEISLDFNGKKPGRGAYLCKSVSCFEKARKGRKLEKAFETSIDEEIYELLKKELEAGND